MSLLPIFIRDVRKECMYNEKSRLYWIMTARNFVLMRCVSTIQSNTQKEVRVMFMSADLTYHCLHMRIEDYRTVSHSVQLRKRYFSDILLPLELLFFPFTDFKLMQTHYSVCLFVYFYRFFKIVSTTSVLFLL